MNRTGKTVGAAVLSAFLGILIGGGFYMLAQLSGRVPPWNQNMVVAASMKGAVGFGVLFFSIFLRQIRNNPGKSLTDILTNR